MKATTRLRDVQYQITLNARQTHAIVTCCGLGYRYELHNDAHDIENLACIGEQLRHKALYGTYTDKLSSEEAITAYGRVFRVQEVLVAGGVVIRRER